jgi:hypothetical protein
MYSPYFTGLPEAGATELQTARGGAAAAAPPDGGEDDDVALRSAELLYQTLPGSKGQLGPRDKRVYGRDRGDWPSRG